MATDIWVNIGLGNMASCLAAPGLYLNQWQIPISEFLWYSPDRNFTAIAQATILYNQFKIVIF